MVDTSLVQLGQYRVVRWMRFKDSYPAFDYLNELNDASVRARVLALCRMITDRIDLPDGSNAHSLSGKFGELYELKPKGHRIFGFWVGETLYLACGAKKKKAKEQVADHERAHSMRVDFFEREAAKTGGKKGGSQK